MCLVVVALDAHPRYPLVVAANRDEFHARPAAKASWGDVAPFAGILAGRDLEAGGTWLGVRRDGRWALVTNVREGGRFDANARSRGDLVPRLLNAEAPPGAALPGMATTGTDYNGFNLLAGDSGGVVFGSNRAPATRTLESGVHGLSNASLDTPWPKVEWAAAAMRAWAAAGRIGTDSLFAALAATSQAPDGALPDTGVSIEWERLLSSPFIVSERYGTRCSTVFTIDHHGCARFQERTFDPAGTAHGDVLHEFALAAG